MSEFYMQVNQRSPGCWTGWTTNGGGKTGSRHCVNIVFASGQINAIVQSFYFAMILSHIAVKREAKLFNAPI